MRRRLCHLHQPHSSGFDHRERPEHLVRQRQPAQGRRAERGADRGTAGQPGAEEGLIVFDWIASFLEGGGYLGIAALMFLENVFPPIPSELIMPMAGFASTLLWYEAGRRFGAVRLRRMTVRWGRWLTMTP